MDDQPKTRDATTAANIWIGVAFCLGVAFGIGGTVMFNKKASSGQNKVSGVSDPLLRQQNETKQISMSEMRKMESEVQAVAHTKDVARRDALRVALKIRGVTQQELDQIESKGLKDRGFMGDWRGDQRP